MIINSIDQSTDGSALVAAVEWVRDLLTGTLGISVAVIAIAFVGYQMLQGRLAWRDGARVVLGAFILFGAPVIASGLAGLAHGAGGEHVAAEVYSAPAPVTLPAKPPTFDPYAGASVPHQ